MHGIEEIIKFGCIAMLTLNKEIETKIIKNYLYLSE